MRLPFWMGIGAVQKDAQTNARHTANREQRMIAIVVSALLALVAVAGLLVILVSQH